MAWRRTIQRRSDATEFAAGAVPVHLVFSEGLHVATERPKLHGFIMALMS
jgi:hypothetical protein